MVDFSNQKWEEKVNCVKELSKALNNMPLNLSDALLYLMDTYSISINELSKYSGVSVTTIKHIRGHVKTDCSLNTAVRLCVGMKLNPVISYEFIRRTSHRFTYSEEHIHYEMLLNNCEKMRDSEIQEYLRCIEQKIKFL